jgi:hypothetical protein
MLVWCGFHGHSTEETGSCREREKRQKERKKEKKIERKKKMKRTKSKTEMLTIRKIGLK